MLLIKFHKFHPISVIKMKEESDDSYFFADMIGSSLFKISRRSSPSSPGMSHFRTAPIDSDILPSQTIVPQDEHLISQGKLNKLLKSETDAFTNVFGLIPLDDASEKVLNNYNLATRVREVSCRLQQYGMKDIFDILQFSDPSSCKILSTTPHVLDQWDIIHVDVLKHHISFLHFCGQKYDL